MDILRPVPLGEQVAFALQREIVTGTFASGDLLTEDALAARYSVSRSPVRDALRNLEQKHLLERTGRSYRIVGITPEDIDEVYELRGLLENLAWRLAAIQSDRAAIGATLGELLDTMQKAADDDDVAAFAHADIDFHSAVVSATGKKRLIGLWEQLEPSIRMILEVTAANGPEFPSVLEAHRSLSVLLEAGDTEALAAALDSHLLYSRTLVS